MNPELSCMDGKIFSVLAICRSVVRTFHPVILSVGAIVFDFV
uniref:Uncharacterized protein n=1 Tax=Arundo donax TaxID=35708 RepID=A0A0A9FRJ9_ARUDO